MRIKVLSYNIHKGFDWKNQIYQIENIKKLIIDSRADIVFLQEVLGENKKLKKNGYIDTQISYLVDDIWPHSNYGKNAIYEEGHHGNLILSKFPITLFENINISTNRFEKRGLLLCQVKISEQKINVGCVHLNLLHSQRIKQYQLIGDHLFKKLNDEDTPLIMAGDFNDWNQKASDYFEKDLLMKEAFKDQHGQYAKTFPSFFPKLCLDRIYIKNIKPIFATLIRTSTTKHYSDHLPILCELELE